MIPFALAVLLASASAVLAAERPPNIILIFTDDQGYADVGVFGAKGFTTPHLDRMAAEGRRFTNFHVPQAVCSASRASLLTGCYSDRIGLSGALFPNATHGLAEPEITLAELLRDKGYATGMAGKWHLGHHPQFLPTRHGFDEYLGLPYSNDMWPHNAAFKSDRFPPLPLIEGETIIQAGLLPRDQEQLTTRYTERAVQFIERNQERPFFFYLAHSMPHVPLYVSAKFKGKSQQGLYGDVIMEIDWSVGQILEALQRHGLDENTLVIFTSDNGPWLDYGNHGGSAHPLREGKTTAWEGGTRVPCVMRWPGKLPAGTTSDAMLMTIDLLPTIARLVGAELPPHPIDGRNVWPLLAGQPDATHPHEAYAYYYGNNQLRAVVSGDGRWKLVLPHTYPALATSGRDGVRGTSTQVTIAAPELYDLERDIGETRNVAAAYPEIVRRLQVFADSIRAELGDTLTGRRGRGVREPGRLTAGR